VDTAVKPNGTKSGCNMPMILGHLPSLLIIATSFCLCLLPAFAQAQGAEWVLEQKHADLGKFSLYVSHNAIKIVSRQWGYQLLARAPRWTVHCFRPEEKIEWIGELDAFNGDMLQNPMAIGNKKDYRFDAFGTGLINGLKYTKYAPSRQSLSAIYGADEMVVAPMASDFICRLYGFPDCGKIPLYCSNDRGLAKPLAQGKNEWLKVEVGRDLRGGLVTQLVTESWKKVPFNASDFAYPLAYKILRSASEVAYSSKQKDTMTEVLNEVGFSTEQGGAHKQLPAPAKVRSSGPQ